jgi:short subunit fatty acids transporter
MLKVRFLPLHQPIFGKMNYLSIAIIILLAAAVIGLLVWKNSKDEKKVTKEMNESELKPEKHDENHPD